MSAAPMTPAMGGQGAGGHGDENGHERGPEQKAGKRKRPGKKHRVKARKAAEAAKEAAANSALDADAGGDTAVDEHPTPQAKDNETGHEEAPAVPLSPPDETPEEACLDSKDVQAPQHDQKETGGETADLMDRLQTCQREADQQRGQLARYEEELAEVQGLQKAAVEEAARDKKRVEALERSLAEAEEKLCAEQATILDLRAELRGVKSAMACSAREKKQLEKELLEKVEEAEGLKEEAKEAKLVFERRLASLEKALGEGKEEEERARSTLVQENERLRAELTEAREELVDIYQRLLDSEAEMMEERRRRQRPGSQASEAPRGHTRLGSELSQLGGEEEETLVEGHFGSDGEDDSGSSSLAKATASTGTQTDPVAAASNGAVPPSPTTRLPPPLPLFRRRDRTTPPRRRARSLSGPEDLADLFDAPTAAKPGKASVAAFVWQRIPTNPFLWLLWLLSVLYLVSLVGKEYREWELANGGSGFAFVDLFDDFLPADPLVRSFGISVVGTNAYRHYALG